MNKTTEALKLALEYCDDNMSAEAANVLRMALADHIANTDKMVGCAYCDNPLFAGTKCNNCGRVTLAEPVKQEPVAVISESAIGLVKLHSNGACLPFGTQLYAAPVERQWVDLTDDEIGAVMDFGFATDSELENARAVIAAFKDKNK